MSTIAIDFGTTATCVAFTVPDDPTVRTATHEMSGDRFPSAVYLDQNGQLLTGPTAANSAGADPSRFEATPKRQVTAREHILVLGGTEVEIGDAVRAVISSEIAPALEHPGGFDAVLTHPVAWTGQQIEIVVDAVRRSGLSSPLRLPEPVAAAWEAVPDSLRDPGASFAIYDWGGGTFDVAVVTWNGTGFEVVGDATRGVDPLGGDNVDFEFAQHIIRSDVLSQEIRDRLAANDPTDVLARKIWHLLRRDVRDTKHNLSQYEQGEIGIGLEWTVPVTRRELDEVARPYVDRTMDEFDACLAEAEIDIGQLAGVYLTGDASKMPLVAGEFWHRHGIRPPLAPGAKVAVARGAVKWATAPRPAKRHETSPDPSPEITSDQPHVTAPDPAPQRERDTTPAVNLNYCGTLSVDTNDLSEVFQREYQENRTVMSPVYSIEECLLTVSTATWSTTVSRFEQPSHTDVSRADVAGVSLLVADENHIPTGGGDSYDLTAGEHRSVFGRPGYKLCSRVGGPPVIAASQAVADKFGRVFAAFSAGVDDDGTTARPAKALDLTVDQAEPPHEGGVVSLPLGLAGPPQARRYERIIIGVQDRNHGQGWVVRVEAVRNSAFDNQDQARSAVALLGMVVTDQASGTFDHPLGSFSTVHGISPFGHGHVAVLAAVANIEGQHLGIRVIRACPKPSMFRKVHPAVLCSPFLAAVGCHTAPELARTARRDRGEGAST